jgi:predicted RNA binding protein YcfA (HicA-like mRNA interferase family)
MTKLRQLSAREVLKALGSFGFQVATIRGSHAKLKRLLPSGERQTVTIPLHKSLTSGTMQAIFRQSSRYIPEADLRAWFFTEER